MLAAVHCGSTYAPHSVFICGMLRWFCVFAHLLVEAAAACWDARTRFLKLQVKILHRKRSADQVIPTADDRARPFAVGQELNHDVAAVIGVVRSLTDSRLVKQPRTGREPKRVRRPKIARNLREFVVRLAKETCSWDWRQIVGELRTLRLRIGRSTVRRVFKGEGLTRSHTTWRLFTSARAESSSAHRLTSRTSSGSSNKGGL